MSQCIISIGSGQRYSEGINRLRAGIYHQNFNGTVWLQKEYPEGCPLHSEIPYGFKPWAFDWARRQGYQQVIWLDSACVPVKPMDGLFHLLREYGTIMPYSPLRAWEWCSDTCAKQMGVSRQRLMGFCPSLWACVMGLDFSHEVAGEFLDRWLGFSRDGISFHGAFTNDNQEVSVDSRVKGHRHDQTVAAILCFQMGIPFNKGVVSYDVMDIMPLSDYGSKLNQPDFPAVILSNHNVKTKAHAD